jgi:hypothetical protein
LGLAAVPILIHLINMMRHRRVQWAAMEFLLASYKKHRNWIWLKQLILLLMRIAAILFLVTMLAGVGCRDDQFAALFGGRDASYVLWTIAFHVGTGQRGVRVRSRAGSQDIAIKPAAGRRQRFTLVRFSRAAASAEDEAAAAVAAKVKAGGRRENKTPTGGANQNWCVDGRTVRSRGRQTPNTSIRIRRWLKSPAFEPPNSLLVRRRRSSWCYPGNAGDENRKIYVVSDFRTNSGAAAEPKKHLQALQEAGQRFLILRRSKQPNLAITELSPANETRAVGVPLFVNVTVKNFGRAPPTSTSKCSVFCEDPGGANPGEAPKQVDDLPPVLIEEIAPGESVVGRSQVFFPKSGVHAVEAELPADPVAADNRRFAVIDFPAAESILLIDGDADRRNEFYLTSVFQPGSRANTGSWSIRNRFILNNVGRGIGAQRSVRRACFGALTIDKLEAYVKNGGVAISRPDAQSPGITTARSIATAGFFPARWKKKLPGHAARAAGQRAGRRPSRLARSWANTIRSWAW